MATVTQKFFSLEVSITDDRTNLIELNQLAFNTLSLLIPEARKVVSEERQQMNKMAETGCDEEGEEECPFAAKEKEEAQKELSELYI